MSVRVFRPRALLSALALSTAALAAPAWADPAAAHYTTADTEIGTLLDDPAAKAILDKYVPGMTANSQIEMARAMTLRSIQQYAPNDLTDAKLAQIDAEFAKLPAPAK